MILCLSGGCRLPITSPCASLLKAIEVMKLLGYPFKPNVKYCVLGPIHTFLGIHHPIESRTDFLSEEGIVRVNRVKR